MPEFDKIAFVGLGKMGAPMARNQLRTGLLVLAYDALDAARAAAEEPGSGN